MVKLLKGNLNMGLLVFTRTWRNGQTFLDLVSHRNYCRQFWNSCVHIIRKWTLVTFHETSAKWEKVILLSLILPLATWLQGYKTSSRLNFILLDCINVRILWGRTVRPLLYLFLLIFWQFSLKVAHAHSWW